MAKQAELVGLSIGLEPLPGETLFSWCSRYHQLAVNGHARTTCLQLFGHARLGTAHDFPARVGTFTARTGGAFGTAAEILNRRTVLPFYLPFRPPVLGHRAVEALSGEGIGHLKYRLGLLTSGLGAAHPLKACPVCVADDLSRCGWACWRRDHQLPAVWVCAQHRVPLQVSPLKLDQVARFSWVLPSRAACVPVVCLEGLRPASAQAVWLLKLGALGAALPGYPAGCFDDPVRIGLAVRNRLTSLGLARASGRIRWTMVEPVLLDMAMNLAFLPELSHQADSALLRTQLLRLLSGRALTHPVRYLVWIATLFDGLEDFERGYAAANVVVEPSHLGATTTARARHGPNEQQEATLLQAVEGKISVTAAAKSAGVSYATMAAWSARHAVEPLRRPKKVAPALLEQMRALLNHGADKDTVAQSFDVSIVTVTRILRTLPGLQEQWHAFRHEQRRASARQAWEEVASLNAFMDFKALRRLQPAAYAWLYRNDRDWLKNCAEIFSRASFGNHAKQRIESADERMALALKNLVARGCNAQALTLDSLKLSVPRIEKAVRSPARWPRTIRALEFVLTCRTSASHPTILLQHR